MENRFAKIISYVFHPLMMPTYAYMVLLHLKAYFSIIIPASTKWLIIGFIFITTFLLPSLISMFMMRRGMVRSMQMESREERTLPYMVTTVFFYITYYFLKNLQISPVYSYFMAGATFLVIFVLVINLFWKISGHMISIGSVLGAIVGLSVLMQMNLNLIIIISILFAGLIAYSRLKLGAHTPTQVYAGYGLGILVMGGLFLML